ncbi:MAG: ABC transporter permease subunit [Candidatus Wallbacteria bacterium]|nr:ABC transporter permease subunit [Candidatus Wallbacteria bacterium]
MKITYTEKILLTFFSPLLVKRIRKFKTLRRGYYSFLIITGLYFLSFFSEYFINGNALIVKYDGSYYFPIFRTIPLKKEIIRLDTEARKAYTALRDKYDSNPEEEQARLKPELDALKLKYEKYEEQKKYSQNYRLLKKLFSTQNEGNWLILPIYPYSPNENLLDELVSNPPTHPDNIHFFGTDDRGRDVFARLVYGFRISMSFALILTLISYIIGIAVGAFLGYYGKKIDFFGVRLIEIWSGLPFLYTVMIVSSIVIPSFFLLIFILTFFSWMGVSYYIRGEFLREKSKDYVLAAVAIGLSDRLIIFRHILPNALTPVIAFLPFTIVGAISSLVSLDFLGFGLPQPTPSWGELLGQGSRALNCWWLGLAPVSALFLTLMLVTFIGEAIREAFDPRIYSRLR